MKTWHKAAAVVWLLAVCAFVWQFRSDAKPVDNLTELEKAAAKLREAGFSTTEVKPPNFMASVSPISEDDANLISASSSAPAWSGKVRVSAKFPMNEFPDHVRVESWGRLFVYGDAETVKRIVSIE